MLGEESAQLTIKGKEARTATLGNTEKEQGMPQNGEVLAESRRAGRA